MGDAVDSTSKAEQDKLSDNDSSLSLSLTPPIPDEAKTSNNSSISEHIENDRSYQEIEISNSTSIFFNSNEEVLHISQELTPLSLNASDISLAYVKNSDNSKLNNVQSILDEILNNEKFVSEGEDEKTACSNQESLNIFGNVDLDDKSLSNYKSNQLNDFSLNLNEKNLYASNFNNNQPDDEIVRDFEELIAVKDKSIAALTSELDSFREMSNSNPNTFSMISTTEYKQLQEDCQNKIQEYNSAIIYKNDLIQQLSESLDQSIAERQNYLKQIDQFKEQVAQLHSKLNIVEEQEKPTEELHQLKSGIYIPMLNLESEYSTIEETMSLPQISLFNDIKIKINDFLTEKITETKRNYEEELQKLHDKTEAQRIDYDGEITRLRDLLANIKCGSTEIMELKNELEAKHSREMEDLRQYFEKKCSDVEKNYSEEIFSQHSRKMSGSSNASDADLNSEALFSHPGPGGDQFAEIPSTFTTKDLINFKNELTTLLSTFDQYEDLSGLNASALKQLKDSISKSNLNVLLKCDLISIRSKHERELSALQEQLDNEVKALREENLYLSNQLKQIVPLPAFSTTTQEVANSGDFEINEVVQSYERRLQEQVYLAKIDIINALENQIQRLVANESDEEEWPTELLQLRDRFTEKYELEIEQIRAAHDEEITKLKVEHLKILNGTLERAKRRRSLHDDSLNKSEAELIIERDNLKKQTISLRNSLRELLKYFTQCEDELNNTLVEELLKQNFDKSQFDDDLNLQDSSTSSSKTDSQTKRVHITPNFNDLINLIENSHDDDQSLFDSTTGLKNELGLCLEKLKQDANAILALTTNMNQRDSIGPSGRNSLEGKLSSLTRQLISETQLKDRLNEELQGANNLIVALEKTRDSLENQLDQIIVRENMLEQDLEKAKAKIAELIENGHEEIVSQGYGEDGLCDTVKILEDLQEEARATLSQSRASFDPKLLHLIEELCRVGEKIKEESSRERKELVQQALMSKVPEWFGSSSTRKIDAADKKYKTTREFLEEQANEREMERDEAQKKIDQLGEQLKEREKDRVNHERVSTEVDHLESQLQELTQILTEQSQVAKEIQIERDDAVEKIKELRDIIRDLETQLESKQTESDDYLTTIKKLQTVLEAQTKSLDDDAFPAREMRDHIHSLEKELEQLRVYAELAGSEGAIKQIKLQLFEFELALEKKTKDLESLHQTTTNSCSSPSEDMSVRDTMRPRTPDECEVPLQQLARLKEKLVRHSRAEDAAIKRIRDLEMHIFGLKNDLEETQNEKDFMKKQIQEQLVLISDLQIRLDEQRIRAEHIEKQTNTSLEGKIYDLQSEIINLQEKLQNKDKTIGQLNGVVEDTKKRLVELEMQSQSSGADDILVEMQLELEQLRDERKKHNKQVIPNCFDTIIAEKNSDIEQLRAKLSAAESLLENSKKPDFFGADLSDGPVRKSDSRLDNYLLDSPQVFKRNANETVFLGHSTQEFSSIEQVGPTNLHYTVQAPLPKPNSTELHEKKVHFEDIDKLKLQLEEKCRETESLVEKLQQLNALEVKIEKLQAALEETEAAFTAAMQTFEKEKDELVESGKTLQIELAEKKLKEAECLKRIDVLEQDSKRKDQMCVQLAKEKRDLEKLVQESQSEDLQKQVEFLEKNQEVLEEKLTSCYEKLEKEQLNGRIKLDALNEEIEELQRLSKEQKDVIVDRECEIEILNEDAKRYQNDLDQMRNSHEKYADLTKEIHHLQELLSEKDKIIAQMSEDSRKLHDNLVTIKAKIKEVGNIVDLGQKLRDEQRRSAELLDQVHDLKAQLLQYETKKGFDVDEIAGQVRRELDYSAEMDSNIINAVTSDHSLSSISENGDNYKRAKNKLCEDLKQRVKELEAQLDKEKTALQFTQLEDAKLIEQMRIQLDAAMDNEEQFEELLKSEKIARANLEGELELIKKKTTNFSGGNSNSRSDSTTDYKLLPTKEALELSLVREELEKEQGQTKLLQGEVKNLKKAKHEAENNEKYMKDMLALEMKRSKKLAEQIERLMDELTGVRKEFVEKRVQLESKVRNIEDMASIESLNQENAELLKERDEQTERMAVFESVRKQLRDKVKELNESLVNNKKLVEVVRKLQLEKQVLEAKLAEGQTNRMRNVPFEDLVAKNEFLFAKALRLESTKKSLIFQKRYLLNYLNSHQNHCVIKALPYKNLLQKRQKKQPAINRFRSAVLVVISTLRMKYLVKRWHTGERFSEYVSSARHHRQQEGAQFHIGQPVSNQNFIVNQLSDRKHRSERVETWTGLTPPSKESRAKARLQIGSNILRRDNLTPLQAPKLLAEFTERFDQIQEKLGVVLDNSSA